MHGWHAELVLPHALELLNPDIKAPTHPPSRSQGNRGMPPCRCNSPSAPSLLSLLSTLPLTRLVLADREVALVLAHHHDQHLSVKGPRGRGSGEWVAARDPTTL